MSKARLPLLVVDGYNVLRATPRYAALMDERPDRIHVSAGGSGRAAGGGMIGVDPFERAREALVADVAAFAQGSYEATIVYDGANNLSPDRPATKTAGVRIVFSAQGESADAVIERLCAQAHRSGRDIALVTSDNTIRSTTSPLPVHRVRQFPVSRDQRILRHGQLSVMRHPFRRDILMLHDDHGRPSCAGGIIRNQRVVRRTVIRFSRGHGRHHQTVA